MTRTQFVEAIRRYADAVEKGSYYIIDIGKTTMFGNRNYGKIWTYVTEECSIGVDLYNATDEERKEFEEDATV